jgi:acetate kinase
VLLAREASDERARDALALYVHRILHEIGALIPSLGGLDMLVFTAGIGENDAEIRRRVCAGLGYLGMILDKAANARHAPLISDPRSAVAVGVEPTHEEWIMAVQARSVSRQA